MNENFSDGAGRREKGKREGGGSGSQAVIVSVHQPGCSCAVQGNERGIKPRNDTNDIIIIIRPSLLLFSHSHLRRLIRAAASELLDSTRFQFQAFIQQNPRPVNDWLGTQRTPGQAPTSSQCPGAAPGGHGDSLDSLKTQGTVHGSLAALRGRWAAQIARVPLPSVSRHHPYLDVFSRSPSSLPPGKPAIAPSALGIWEACLALWPEDAHAHTREAGAAGSCRFNP
nr:uncharacterized protein LOC110149531 [Odocoileus virginianus texanus]